MNATISAPNTTSAVLPPETSAQILSLTASSAPVPSNITLCVEVIAGLQQLFTQALLKAKEELSKEKVSLKDAVNPVLNLSRQLGQWLDRHTKLLKSSSSSSSKSSSHSPSPDLNVASSLASLFSLPSSISASSPLAPSASAPSSLPPSSSGSSSSVSSSPISNLKSSSPVSPHLPDQAPCPSTKTLTTPSQNKGLLNKPVHSSSARR